MPKTGKPRLKLARTHPVDRAATVHGALDPDAGRNPNPRGTHPHSRGNPDARGAHADTRGDAHPRGTHADTRGDAHPRGAHANTRGDPHAGSANAHARGDPGARSTDAATGIDREGGNGNQEGAEDQGTDNKLFHGLQSQGEVVVGRKRRVNHSNQRQPFSGSPAIIPSVLSLP